MPGLCQHLDHIGQVELALGVVGLHPPERGRQQVPSEHEDPGVDLVDEELVGCCVGLLDDAGHPVVLADPQDASVAGGILHPCRQDRAGRAALSMAVHQRPDRLLAQQRRVSGEDEHVVLLAVVQVVVGQSCQADRHCVAGAPLHPLLDEPEPQPGTVLRELLGDPLRSVPHHHDRAFELFGRQRVEHVEDHGPAAEQVQRLWSGRAHPAALPGSEDHGGQVPRHGNLSTRHSPSGPPRSTAYGGASPSASTSPSTTCT